MNFNTLFSYYLYPLAFLIIFLCILLVIATIFKMDKRWFIRLFYIVCALISLLMLTFGCHWIILNGDKVWKMIPSLP